MYSCPECEQLINQASELCPYCGADQKALAETELLLAGKSPKPTKTNYKRVAVVCGTLLATLWAIAWFAVPWKLSGSKTEAEARARESLAAIQQGGSYHHATHTAAHLPDRTAPNARNNTSGAVTGKRLEPKGAGLKMKKGPKASERS
jgi:hypothetical protein